MAIRVTILARAGGRCEACGAGGRLDVHHIIKRSQGGSDFDPDQLVALCRRCHDRTDAPFARSRLVITPVGAGRFRFEVVRRTASGEMRTRIPTVHVLRTLLHLGPARTHDGV